MADAKDKGALRTARTLLTKHGLDISLADIHVSHGTCYIRGLIRAMPGFKISDVPGEVLRVSNFIRQKPGIRSVVVEISR